MKHHKITVIHLDPSYYFPDCLPQTLRRVHIRIVEEKRGGPVATVCMDVCGQTRMWTFGVPIDRVNELVYGLLRGFELGYAVAQENLPDEE